MKRFLGSGRSRKATKPPNSPSSKIKKKTQEDCMTPHPTPIYMFSETRKQTTEESVGPAATRVWQGGGVV